MSLDTTAAQPKKILAISGSDVLSGGGFQADLATYSQYGIYGFVAITSIVTAENDVFEIFPTASWLFEKQLKSFDKIDFDAIKIGLLPTPEIAELALDFVRTKKRKQPLIFDPVLVFKENNDAEIHQMLAVLEKFLPFATIITPNLREAEILSGMKIIDLADMTAAAQAIYDKYAVAVVIKGGNRLGNVSAVDVYYDGVAFETYSKPLLASQSNNGAGCTFASSIASGIVLNGLADLPKIISDSKTFVYQAILSANEYGVFQHEN
ncbi:bifunctional hydroxymethylpyrimidine kinase/phosphomethylpyrimidine kinase [Pseudolactococcus insecticola]|uniref:pyridoxal kinase n=1 Tax=Pseudolactococcus insecticola TaxID=2709158 RepID=A0A6A0B6I2_9LACT|nr:bifunctional hydroxymethylpyrimidine kinase/phosphomethylpyrimidine kinase [Lactococcus insecticola]GFH40118.1 hydroxymethylpyrimidine/phosphomethylpyrimidine kinase [Lactococcus insecticola]